MSAQLTRQEVYERQVNNFVQAARRDDVQAAISSGIDINARESHISHDTALIAATRNHPHNPLAAAAANDTTRRVWKGGHGVDVCCKGWLHGDCAAAAGSRR